MEREPCCRGAVFDLDGVLTQTARVHFKAWRQTFEEFLQEQQRGGRRRAETLRPFTYQEDYLPYVDGKPRYQGVRSFLDSRDIRLPYGDPSDPPERKTVCGLGNRKNALFRELVARDGVETYESTVEFIRELKRRGAKVAVASSSMNCRYILETTGLDSLFEAVVGGTAARELGLKGKPNPDIFLVAADNLGVHPSTCLMVEDAQAGVEAGRRGNFALVIGVARSGETETLQGYGADIVVRDMRELTWPRIRRWFDRGMEEDSWRLAYFGFAPEQERLRESLTTVGNGFFGTRGCFEASHADETVHYPGTYIAGVYNRLPSAVYRRTIVNNDLVNCPNWLLLELSLEEEGFRNPLEMELLSYRHWLDMRGGVVSRSLTFRDEAGRVTTMESDRIASMADPHLGAIRLALRPENWAGRLTVRSTLDGTVVNYGVARYRELNSRHLAPVTVGEDRGCTLLEVQTVTSKIRIFLRARTSLYAGQAQFPAERSLEQEPGRVSELLSFQVQMGRTVQLEKIVSIHTSKDQDGPDPRRASEELLEGQLRFAALLVAHRKAWHSLWRRADIAVQGDRFAQQVMRLHTYHLFCTAGPHNLTIDAGLPARGLHGEAYRGHIFWDELFAYPFYNLHFPEVSRALLLYRYRRLEGARDYAREQGRRGAMFPWQTADNGNEETQELHFNPVSGRWGPDLSSRQRHVSIAVAYNVWEYFYCTNDLEFLYNYGAEILLQTTRFWASSAELDDRDGRYHIRGVMGPDEFHEKYPDGEEGGLSDNAYTNILVSWLMHKTIETLEYLPARVMKILREKTGFTPQEIESWRAIVTGMTVELAPGGIINQFAGYQRLKELDWEHYREKYGEIGRLDRILKAEGDSPDRYKLAKQADVLMTFYLLSPGQVRKILELMGYEVGDELELMARNYEYYLRRTSHGSTLSFIVHAGILKHLPGHRNDMWRWFLTALRSDIEDIQGGTTQEGIHTGVMGGTLDVALKSLAGLSLYKDAIEFTPDLPDHWRQLAFRITHRRNWFRVQITQEQIRVRRTAGSRRNPVDLVVGGRRYSLPERETVVVAYDRMAAGQFASP